MAQGNSNNYEKLAEENKKLRSSVSEKDEKIKTLEHELLWLQKKMFGKMSEKRKVEDPNQLNLFNSDFKSEEEFLNEAKKEEDEITKVVKKKVRNNRTKNPSWENLPIVEEIYDPKEKDDSRYIKIGEEVSYRLAYEPSMMYLKKIIRTKYALKKEIAGTEQAETIPSVVIAPVPSSPIPKGLADSSLLAYIVLQKYLYHMPFYRLVESFKNLGVKISTSTIGDWFADVCELVKPLYDKLREQVLSQDYIQIDESTLPVIDNEKHRAVKGYIWAVNDPINKNVFFYYDRGSRATRIADFLLTGFKGSVQSDGYNAYNKFEKDANITMLGCFAHARRKFNDALKENEKLANDALNQIASLYAIESKIKEMDLSYEEKAKFRIEKAVPILNTLEEWLKEKYSEVLPKSIIGKAISYTYCIYPKLRRYVLDGRYKIDNNLIENAIRPLSLGRKNFMFCGNNDAAIRAAIMYSLIGTCKASGVNPVEWFSDILNKMPEYIKNGKDTAELLPNSWEKARLSK